jgi:hypothetical protein
MLEQTLFQSFFILYFCLLFLKFLNLIVQSLNLTIFGLAHFKGLLLIKFLSLFDFFVDKILMSFLSNILNNFYVNVLIPCFLRYYSIFSSSYLSFWRSIAFSSLFFSLRSLIYLLFCMLRSLLSRSRYSYMRIAYSALSLSNYPSSISSLYLLIYCFLTYLCCFRIFF